LDRARRRREAGARRRVRKSIGAENTFFDDLFSFDAAREALMPIIENVWRHCEATRIRGRTVS